MSTRRDSLLQDAVDSVRRVSIEIAGSHVGASVADAATALATGGATMVSYLLPEADKNSLWSNIVFTNAQAVAGAIIATAALLVVLGLMHFLPPVVNQPSLLVCLMGPLCMCWTTAIRWAEDEFRVGIRIQLPTSLLLTAGAFVLFKGDLGNWTLPITTLIQPIAMSTKCLILKDKGNMLKYAVGNLSFWIVFMLGAMMPAYGVVAPALLLAHDPNLYAAWCGAGYPTLAFGVRKACLSYAISIFRSANKEGKMSTEAMVKCIKGIAFVVSVAVLEGNIMLLYLSQNLKYAAIASIFSIFTETAGKAYVVRSTQALIDKHIKKGIKKGSAATAAAMIDAMNMAGNEGGVNHALEMAGDASVVPELLARVEELSKEKAELVREKAMLEMVEEELSKIVVELGEANKRLGGDWDEANVEARLESARARTAESNDEEEGSVANEAVDEVQNEDEKMTPEFWAEILAMLAIRWSQEIIVEKTCIIYGAVATMLIDAVKSPHNILVQLQLLAIFYSCELVADFLLVFVLDGRFSVPLLRIPQPAVRSKQFWKDAAQGVFPLVICVFGVIYAHHTVTQWIGDGGGAGGEGAGVDDEVT